MPRDAARRARAFALFIVAPALAQAAEAPILRWEDLRAQIAAQPELLAASAAFDAATGAQDAIALPNPELELARGRAETLAPEAPDEADTWELTLSLPLRPWGPWRHERAAARAGRDAAAAELIAARRSLTRDLAARFWQVAHDQRQARLLAETEAQLARLVEIAALRVQLGEARPLEPLRLEMELETLRAEIRAAAGAARLAREALGRRLGLEPAGDFSVDADWDTLPPLPPPAAADAAAHPALLAATARGTGADAAFAAARADRWPGLRVGAFCARELDSESEGLSLALELPLFDRRGGAVTRARAEATLAEQERRLIARELADALAAADAAARLARERAQGLREAVLPRAAQVLAAAEAEYRVGETDLVTLLDARRAHADTESDLLAAELAYRLALAELEALIPGDDHD